MSHATPSMNWSAVRRLLVVLPSWVGDATMATPLLACLRQDERLRQTRIIGYMRPGLDELLDGGDQLDEMIIGKPAGLTGPWREGRRLATGEFDAAILLPNSWRLAATIRLARIAQRIGYDRDARGWMLTHRLPSPAPGGWKQPIPAVDYYLAIGESLGVPQIDRRMRLRASAAQQAAASTILAKAGVREGDAFAILNPGASKAQKRWPTDRFAALADHLANRHGLKVLVNGSPNEHDVIAEVCNKSKSKPISLVQLGITLGPLKHIASRARLLVTNDTGTRHIAAAAATGGPPAPHSPPLAILSLFGPTDPRWAQIEYQREKQISVRGEPMTEILLDTVQRSCDELLELDP